MAYQFSSLSIEEMRSLAKSRNGECLSQSYTNYKTKLTWQCNFGHNWDARPDLVKRGRWCPQCSNKKPKTMIDMEILATKRDGLCLSKEIKNVHTKLQWQCENQHRFMATPNNVRVGHWCKKCVGLETKTLQDMQSFAHKKDGLCLSTHYINNKQKLLWQCQQGHQWQMRYNEATSGFWCIICKNELLNTAS
jgi:hypothetical protein